MDGNLGWLDDPDYPAYTMEQAAQLLGVQRAFLRSLDAAGVVRPRLSEGGHWCYSRTQLELAQRIRELLDQGHALAKATRILGLERELADAKARIKELQDQIDADEKQGRSSWR